jgi:cytochrome o ubiquinol oxidase operon protein cyoD
VHHYLPYIIGFSLSLGLTIVAFALTKSQVDGQGMVVWVGALLLALASLQVFVQLRYFFHLSDGDGPKFTLLSTLTMLMVVVIVGLGSLWIMYHLNYNMMSGHEIETYVEQDENINADEHHQH